MGSMSEEAQHFSLTRRSFSRILEITGRRLTYDVTSVGFYPGLRIIMTFACFRGLASFPVLLLHLVGEESL
jgi:hypothetical protein